MAYDDQKVKPGREPVMIAEIDFPICSLTYGNSPCAASGAAGTECFNSYATCQDRANYAPATKTFRFSSVRIDGIQGPDDAPTFPTLLDISTAPTILTPGKGLGVRSKCTVNLSDMPWSDVGIDKYLSNRNYDPMSQGSFWSKQVTRFPFYENLELRIKTGYLTDDGGYDSSNFVTRTYFIESIKGPSENGKVSIIGKDILKFADGEKAKVPIQSQAVLSGDINNSVTSVLISDPNDDVKNAYDGGQNYIRVDNETMLISNITGTSPNYTLTVTRAAMPSFYPGTMNAEDHSEGATVQNCYFYDDMEVDDIIYDLLNVRAGINNSYLPTSDWQDIIDFGLQNYRFSALIVEPTSVKDLLEEITQHTILIWFDEREQKVKIDSIIKRDNNFGPLNDQTNIKADSVSVTRDDKNRFSQVWLHYGLRNPVLEMDEIGSFSSVKVSADLASESQNQYNQTKIKEIFSRWLPISKSSVASEISNRLVNYYRDTKNVITISLDPKDDDAWTGDRVSIVTRLIQNRFGQATERNYRVLQVNETFRSGQFDYKYQLHSTGGFYDDSEPSTYGVIAPDTYDGQPFPDYSNATEELKSRYAFICEDNRGDGEAGFSPGGNPYVVV